MVVHASRGQDYVDPRLKSLERYLQHFSYNNFRVLSQKSVTMEEVNTTRKISIEGGRDIAFTFLSIDGQYAKFRVSITSGRGKLADITVSVPRGRPFVVSGPEYEEGILLIPITARF